MSGEIGRWANRVLKAASGIDRLGEKAVTKVSKRAAETARKAAPSDTGRLSRSIRVTVDGSRAVVETDLYYAAFQEFGTSKMAPNPFMGPAFQGHAPELVREVEGIADEIARQL